MTLPLALVMGDVDMVRALGVAGISSALFGFADESGRYSRHVSSSLPWIDHWARQDAVVDELLAFARVQDEPPVLFPQMDASILLASRHRERLATGLRLALADAELIEQLMDKSRFQALAVERGLPVPPAQELSVNGGAPQPELEVPFPLVVKPVVRTPGWTDLAGGAKALHVSDASGFARLWPRLAGVGTSLVAQQLIVGPESAIESYHVYVDASGDIAGAFTGRKIRTFPLEYGHSSAVEVTDLPDVAELGRDVLRRLGLTGVAKLDFKRDEQGGLHLLEINPRFNLWHYPGALAGVNLPAMVYADLTGGTRPPAAGTLRDVSWCDPLLDLRAARASGIPPVKWLRWLLGCAAICGLAWADPLPFLRGRLGPALWRQVPRYRRAAS
jgi:predicted ATP-grasp superfamily ATP-dependent carboligase